MTFHQTQVALYLPEKIAIHIDDARNGLDCHCACLDCGRRLVAVKSFESPSGVPYFRHHNPDNTNSCTFSNSSSETALHLALKMQVFKEKRIAAPKVKVHRECPHQGYTYKAFSIYSGKALSFDDVLIEKKTGNIIPDCIGIIGDYRVAIEIKVTHGVSAEKLDKIKGLGLDCLELYAPGQSEESSASSIINDNKYIEWLHFGRASKAEVLQVCDQWFENEKLRVEAIIEAKKQKRILEESAQRPVREKQLVARLMKKWDDEYLRLSPFDHSFYDEFDHDLDDLCSRVPNLHYLPFPYAMKAEVASLRLKLSSLDEKRFLPAAEYAETRKKLISAFKYQYAHCKAEGYQKVEALLDELVHYKIEDLRVSLIQYIDGMRHCIMERKIENARKVWVNKQYRKGQTFENSAYEFLVSPEYVKSISIIHEQMYDLGFGDDMMQCFYDLIERFLEKKYYNDNLDPSIKLNYNAVLRRYQLLDLKLHNEIKLYIDAITGPNSFNRMELNDCVGRLLSSFRIGKECLKELIHIKRVADFNNTILPHNQRIRSSVKDETILKVKNMDDDTLRAQLELSKSMRY